MKEPKKKLPKKQRLKRVKEKKVQVKARKAHRLDRMENH
jgi:hypothetical protein